MKLQMRAMPFNMVDGPARRNGGSSKTSLWRLERVRQVMPGGATFQSLETSCRAQRCPTKIIADSADSVAVGLCREPRCWVTSEASKISDNYRGTMAERV